MKPLEFKSRFVALLPETPPDLDLDLDRFVAFDPQRVASLLIPDEAKAFLLESGLPADAAPFLNFETSKDLSLAPVEGFPDTAIIGFNNYGDAICLDIAAGGYILQSRRQHAACIHELFASLVRRMSL